MTQKEIYDFEQRIKLEREQRIKEYIEDAKKRFVGMNFLDALDEIGKTEDTIEVQRSNVTFISYYPRRTVRPKIKKDEHRTRINQIHLPVRNKEHFKDFDTTIIDIVEYSVITENKDFLREGQTVAVVTGLKFILDDSEELIIKNF